MSDPHYPYVWYWRARLPERHGQPCRVLARGKLNSVLVEFADGYLVVTSRYAVRRKRTENREPRTKNREPRTEGTSQHLSPSPRSPIPDP